jgi:Raf kinase inhibitor-like YbhB/YbcL family protein
VTSTSRRPLPYDFLPPVPSFTLASDDLTDGGALKPDQVHDGFGLGGANRSPHLSWSGFPEQTRGFAVSCFDPDAPTPCGFWHWLLVDVPAQVTELATGAGSDDAGLPGEAFHLRNDLGGWAFAGSAVRPGTPAHRYVFAVHALDRASLGVGRETPAAMVAAHLTAHTFARAVLVAVHGN